jgi:large subunit ribosomal protein L6
MVLGVTEGFSKNLEINGVGYRASKEGKNLVMNLGFSHQVIVPETEGHPDRRSRCKPHRHQGYRQAEGRPVCRRSSRKRPPEPYKGKGIKYDYEHIRRKEGKTGAK